MIAIFAVQSILHKNRRMNNILNVMNNIYNSIYGKEIPIYSISIEHFKLPVHKGNNVKYTIPAECYRLSNLEIDKMLVSFIVPVQWVVVSDKKNKTSTVIYHESKLIREVNYKDFERLKILGEGSFGKVELVKLKLNGELYAMKIFEKMRLQKEDLVEYIELEKNILKLFYHPFLAKMEFILQDEEHNYFIMKYYKYF